ncbi:phage tail tip fiber protein [Pseudomonas juntendi]|uniref:phage tail tip fiber protein n=1 Tax=Pseudomonas juntendi TaxID=2666183 RepID=UPI00345D26A3
MSKSIKSVAKLVTAPIKALYDPVGAIKDVFGGVQGIFAGLTGAAKVSGANSSEPSSQTVRSSKAPVRFILGRVSTGGVLAWVQEQPGDQTSGEWLHIVYVLSEGAIAGVDEIYVDERPLSELGENATSEVIIDPSQANAFLLANCPDWRQEQIGRGLSFVRLSFKYDAEKFPSGIPDVRFVVRGRSDVYDPRNGALGYSANTALLILWYLRNRCAIPDDEIIFESFASAANVCDETVIGPDNTGTRRYFAGAVIGADEKRNTVLDNLLSACAGTLIRVGGRWSLQVGAYYGPADFTINEDMVIGTVEGTTEVSNSDAINTMRGTFVDPAQAWAETDYPEVAIQDWIATDGGELAESQSFAYVTDAYLAQRLANISLRRRRSGGSLAVPLNFNGYNCRPGRAVKVDLPSLNILGEFIVTDWTMGAADACKVTLKPYEQAIFDDAVGQPYDPLGFISLPVGGLAAVTGLAWTPSGVAEVVQGVLSWTPPIQTVLSYTVTIRKGTEVVQSLKIGGEASGCNINGLTSGVYAMSVVAFGPGTRSGEASISVNVGGPPVPESCAVFASVDTITLVPANLQNSLNGGTYEYFYATNPSAPIADAVYLGQGLTFTHTGLAFAREYFYYVRAANAYGKSDFLFVPAATSSDPTQMLDVIAGQITESELGKQLTSRIDLIDMNGPGSVNDRIGTAKTELAQQISEVNNALNTTKGNLQQQITAVSGDVSAAKADLQQQIANVSALAGSLPYRKDKAYSVGQSALGSDGKLYQALKAVPLNTPPPNATYWTDVGQAVVTANGMAARVQTMETKVETLEGATSAQAQQISGLQSSLTTTNGNVSAAQQAAQDAATLAGGKGKVIVQSAAPAVADRLAQNLWIDTTSNANTPKRWSGSAWVAVTDKVATDAAAAAAGALALAQTKADATVVSSLTTRVSDAEGKLTSQATRMDGMQTSIDGKASSQALQQVTSRVTATEQKDAAQDQQLTSQSQALTSLTDSVSKKADASTVQVLGNAVTQQGQELTAQGQSLTQIDVALGQAGGENWIYNPSFEKQGVNGLADGWATAGASGVTTTPSLVPSALAAGEIAQRIDVTGVSASAWSRIGNPSTRRVEVSPGTPVSMSAFVRGTPGITVRCEIQFLNSAGGGISGVPVASNIALTGDFNRVSHTVVAPAGAVRCNYFVTVYGTASITSGFLEADRTQIEFSSVVTGWRDNGAVDAGNAAATASAVQSLTGRVDQAESSLTSQSGSIVSLQNGLTATNSNVTAAQQAAQDAATLAGGKGKVIVQSAAPAVADRLVQNLWIDTTSNANTPKRWSGSAWVAVTDKVATDAAAAAQSALSQVILKADSSALQTLGSTVSQQGQQITADGQAITRIDASLTQVKGDTASNALATSALTGRVGATESGLTSVSGQLTEVSNSIGNAGGENLIYNPSFEKLGANGLAEGWAVASGSGATVSPSVVASALNPKESAQRIDVTGMSASVWARIGNPSSRRIALKPGTPVTLSAYMRGTAGLNVRAEIQFLNSAGSGLPGPQASFTVASGNFARISLSAVAPDGAVECNFFVTCYGTSTISTAFMEVDRAQFELSAVMTGWRDNGQVVLADQSATSTAVDALSSAVSQQAGKIDSATSRTTALENTVNSTSSGLATKASTAAVNTLSGRVAATETGLTAASNSVNRLSSQIGAIGGTGSNLIPAEYAAFTVALPSMHKASTLTLSSEQDAAAYSGYLLKADSPSGSAWLYLAASATDYTLRLTAGRQYIFSAWAKGSAAHGVAIRLRYQSSDGSAVEVALSSVNVGTNLSRVSTVITVPAAAAGPASVVLYTQAGAAAGTTWFDGFMLEEKIGESTAPSAFIPGTSTRQAAGQATALSSLDTKVTQQGTRIESEAKRTDGLYTAVGDANAAIQNEAKARSDADGALSQQIQSTQSSLGATNASVQQISTAQTGLNNRVNAQFSIKVAVTQSGVYALGGIGVGIQNQNGVLQSVVAVLADQFAVINAAGNGYVSPFAIQGGQVFMNDAFIRDGSIINAKIANGAITSAKIGVAEIDTLRIRGNAVTVPVSANSPGNVLGAGVGQWQNLVAVGVQMDEGGFITAQYGCYQGFGSGIRKYQFQMDINGIVIAEGGGDWADGFPNLMGSIGVGPGFFVVTVKWWGENTGVGVRNHNLFAMGTKR